ncbi:MAG: GNAT family N-acetyltransferase [Chitinophagaceae bacterium]|nr:GNAT family N-acetyltransferase [Chitinophagaceae bacterium]
MKIDFITISDARYTGVLRLRQWVLRQPLGLDLMQEDLSDEAHQIIGIVENEAGVQACLLAKPLPENTWKLRQMAVSPEWQGKGLGRQLMMAMEAKALREGVHTITLHARDTAIPFYEKLGYACDGDEFLEVGIPHKCMHKNLV